jgi:hypothetical protein
MEDVLLCKMRKSLIPCPLVPGDMQSCKASVVYFFTLERLKGRANKRISIHFTSLALF